jgi:hypothetical protein
MMEHPQHSAGFDPNILVQRIRRLAMLDTTVFDEVKGDAASTPAAVIVAAASMFLAGIGGWLWWMFADLPDSADIFLKSAILGTLFAIGLYVVWIGISYVMLTQVFRARADMQELGRVMGFAALPMALSLLMFIPILDVAIALLAIVLLFGTTLIAMQSATEAPAGRVLAANAAGFAVWALILSLLVNDENAYAPGFFIFDVGVEYLKAIGDVRSALS